MTEIDVSMGSDRIEIRLLGQLFVRRADGAVVDAKEWRTGKTADLVRLLALGAGQPVAVDLLLDALWPHAGEERSRASLRTAASQVRRVLGPDCLERRLGGLVLRDAWVDAVAFSSLAREARRCVREGRLAQVVSTTREALALYLGDFRAHDASSDWALHERESLSAVHRNLLADAADAAVELGWMRDALEFATAYRHSDPHSERAHRALMQAHAGLGETELALRVYDECRTALNEGLGVDPSPQTAALHLQILSIPPVELSTPPFVGRDTQREWLRAAVRVSLAADDFSYLCIAGPEGAGKSRLVAEVCGDAAAEVIRISCGGTDERRGPARQLSTALERLTEDHEDGEGPPAVVVVVDDAHAASPTSVQRLGHVLEGLEGPAAVIVTTRVGSGGQDAPSLFTAVARDQQRSIEHLTLGALVREDVARLANELLAAVPTPDLVDALLEVTDGFPGAILATAQEWSRGGRLASTTRGLTLMPPREEDSAGPTGTGAPMLVALLEQLSDTELDVLHLTAALRGSVTAAGLAPLLEEGSHAPGDAATRVRSALDRLADLSVLSTSGTGYTFRDPLLRDAVLAWLRPTTRRMLHQRVAERAVLSSAERIEHWLDAGEPRLACAAAMDAADEAMSHGRYEEARAHLERVCALGDLPDAEPADRISVFERLGDACAMVDRRSEARVAYTVAISMARRHEVPGLSRLTAKRDSVSAAPGADSGGSVGGPRSGAGLAEEMEVGPDAGPTVTVESRLRAALDDADRHNDPLRGIEARLLLASLVYTPRRKLSQSRHWAQEALTLTVHPGLRARALLTSFLPGALLGNAQQVSRPLAQAGVLAKESGDAHLLGQISAVRLLVAHDLGEAEYVTLKPAVVGDDGLALDPEWAWLAVRVLTERGDLAGARRADEQPPPVDASLLSQQLRSLASAVLHTKLGQLDTAVEVLQTLIDVAVDEECLLLVPEATARLIALEAPTDLAAAKAHFELLDWAVAGESGLPREGSLRLLARAAIRAAVGEYDGAVSAASNAAGAAEQRGLELLAASAHEVRADNLNRAGRPSEARLALAAAARCYRSCGVVPPPRQPWHDAPAEPVASTGQRPVSPHVS